MTNPSVLRDCVADYALDILESPEEFEHELSESVELQAELAALQLVVNDLAYGVFLMPLPEDLKNRLFDRLNQQIYQFVSSG